LPVDLESPLAVVNEAAAGDVNLAKQVVAAIVHKAVANVHTQEMREKMDNFNTLLDRVTMIQDAAQGSSSSSSSNGKVDNDDTDDDSEPIHLDLVALGNDLTNEIEMTKKEADAEFQADIEVLDKKVSKIMSRSSKETDMQEEEEVVAEAAPKRLTAETLKLDEIGIKLDSTTSLLSDGMPKLKLMDSEFFQPSHINIKKHKDLAHIDTESLMRRTPKNTVTFQLPQNLLNTALVERCNSQMAMYSK
jgi:hypothetical protein